MNPIQTQKARKQYVCEECGRPILAGVSYVFERVTPWRQEAGEFFWSYRAHEACYRRAIGVHYAEEIPS